MWIVNFFLIIKWSLIDIEVSFVKKNYLVVILGILLIFDFLKKVLYDLGGEIFWLLGLLVFYRFGLNISVLFCVYFYLFFIFFSLMWYVVNEIKGKMKGNLYIFVIFMCLFLIIIFKLYRYLWRIEIVLNWKRIDLFIGYMVLD